MAAPPDVVILASEWKSRALIRAQLIEEGLEVVATDTWPMMRRQLRPGIKPRAALVDLKGLPNPEEVLRDVRVLMKPERVFVLTALGTIDADAVRRLGFPVLTRPIRIEEVVRTVAAVVSVSADVISPRHR